MIKVNESKNKNQSRFWLKGCTKCGGDLYLQEEVGDTYIKCIHCGRELSFVEQNILMGIAQPRLTVKKAA